MSLSKQYADLRYVVVVMDPKWKLEGAITSYGPYTYDEVFTRASALREKYPTQTVTSIVCNKQGVYSGGTGE